MNKLTTLVCLFAAGIGTLSAATRYKGDFNNDGKVDLADMVVLAKAINEEKTDRSLHDLNASGSVDDADLHWLADLIISGKLIEDVGINIGIGGWDDGGEDFGGTVGAAYSRRAAGAQGFTFFAESPRYDYGNNVTYVDFGLKSDSETGNICAVYFKLRVPDADFPDGDFVELYEAAVAGHGIYGKPVIESRSPEEKELRFIVFSPSLDAIADDSAPIGRLKYNLSESKPGSFTITESHAIVKGSDNVWEIDGSGNSFADMCYRPLSSISIEHDGTEEIAVGEQKELRVIFNPDDATDKSVEWSSDNTDVATVDNSGVVTVNDKGTATITVRTLDGSNLEASCMIQGVTNTSGIMDAESDVTSVDIYSAKGILLRKAVDKDEVNSLPAGLYILHSGAKSYKVVK